MNWRWREEEKWLNFSKFSPFLSFFLSFFLPFFLSSPWNVRGGGGCSEVLNDLVPVMMLMRGGPGTPWDIQGVYFPPG